MNRIYPGQPAMYWPNAETVWIGVAEYVERTVVIMSWSHGDQTVRREVPRAHVIPLAWAVSLGEFRRKEMR